MLRWQDLPLSNKPFVLAGRSDDTFLKALKVFHIARSYDAETLLPRKALCDEGGGLHQERGAMMTKKKYDKAC